jgi:hypothetical protein
MLFNERFNDIMHDLLPDFDEYKAIFLALVAQRGQNSYLESRPALGEWTKFSVQLI